MELFHKRDVGVEIITNDNLRHLRMLAPDARHEPFGGGEFTILRSTLRRRVPHIFHIDWQDVMGTGPHCVSVNDRTSIAERYRPALRWTRTSSRVDSTEEKARSKRCG